MRRSLLAVALLISGACGDSGVTTEPTPDTPPSYPLLGDPLNIPALPALDPASVIAGQMLYVVHCAECHGLDLEGDPDWMVPNEDGTYLPPPQDASGHTWHHSDQVLLEVVLDEPDFFESGMPPFRDILTEDEVMSILDYFKSTWGPEERDVQWGATVRDAALLES